jgi:hypothetical protein
VWCWRGNIRRENSFGENGGGAYENLVESGVKKFVGGNV